MENTNNSQPTTPERTNITDWAQRNPVLALVVTLLTTAIISISSGIATNKTMASPQDGSVSAVMSQEINSLKAADSAFRNEIEQRAAARDKSQDKLLTREVFEAYHKADNDRMERMEKMLEQILTRPVK